MMKQITIMQHELRSLQDRFFIPHLCLIHKEETLAMIDLKRQMFKSKWRTIDPVNEIIRRF